MKKEKEVKLNVAKEENGKEPKLNKPTPEETLQYKEDFETAMKEFAEAKFQISESNQFSANDTAMFLLDFLNNYALWSKTGWMGVIKMHEVLQEEIKNDNEKTGLCLDYQALEFCGYMLANPGNIGYKSAIEFEKIADKYSNIMTSVGKKIEEAREQLKGVQYLQEKWAAGEQGFYLADLEPKIEAAEKEIEESEELEGKIIQMNTNPIEE